MADKRPVLFEVSTAPQFTFLVTTLLLSAAGDLLNNAVYSPGGPNGYTTNYHDNTSGSNGSCGAVCSSTGYDYVTSLGSPHANNIIPALVAY